MEVFKDVKNAIYELYKHVGFLSCWDVLPWAISPIDDCTAYYWDADEDHCIYADSKKDFRKIGNYCKEKLDKRHYKKRVFKGKELTMVICKQGGQDKYWFRIFDNSKRVVILNSLDNIKDLLPANGVALEILEWIKSDDCWVTDKYGNKLPDAIIDGKNLDKRLGKYYR